MPLRIIEDGFHVDGRAAVPDGAEEVTFRYRPAVPAEVDAYFAERRAAAPGLPREKVRADFLARHLLGWDAVNGKGEAVPHTAENLLRVPFEYLAEIERQVLAYYTSPAAGADQGKSSPPPG